MNGAQLIVKAAVASGIEYCFANPGTTEIPLVAAMASAPALKPVLSLFEGSAPAPPTATGALPASRR